MNKKINHFPSQRFYGGKKKGRVIKVKDETGKITRTVRLTKGLPKGCKTPKRICIKCLKNVIRKNDLNYDLKICKCCMGEMHWGD